MLVTPSGEAPRAAASFNHALASNPAIASRLQSIGLVVRVAELGSFGKYRHIMKSIAVTALCVGLTCLAAESPTFTKLPDSPSKLIEILKGAGERYTIGNVRVDYVKVSDVPYLVSLLDSKEPCRFVDMSISSIYYPREEYGRT